MVPLVGKFTGLGEASGTLSMISEISFPPFGYVLTFDGANAPDDRLFEITWFQHCRYEEIRQVEMRLPLLETASHFPGDYRTAEELERDAAEARRVQRERRAKGRER